MAEHDKIAYDYKFDNFPNEHVYSSDEQLTIFETPKPVAYIRYGDHSMYNYHVDFYPNWFHRKMLKAIFGITFCKIEDNDVGTF